MKFRLAVGIILQQESTGHVLIAKRSGSKDFGAGIWEFPAGRVEEGETLEDALRREAKEELDIIITSYRVIDAYTFSRGDIPMVLISYLCSFSGEVRISEEHDMYEWLDPHSARSRFVFERQRITVDNIY